MESCAPRRCSSVKNGERVTVAGLVLVRQRPGTAQGVIFMTLEDETGVANIIVWPKVFERLRAIVLGARFVAVTGKLQSEQGVIHIVAERMNDLTPMLGLLSETGATISALARADEARRTEPTETRKRQGNRFAQAPRFDDPRAAAKPPPETRGRQGDAGGTEFPVIDRIAAVDNLPLLPGGVVPADFSLTFSMPRPRSFAPPITLRTPWPHMPGWLFYRSSGARPFS